MSKKAAKVLVDTSVWIDFFQGNLPLHHKSAFITLLDAEEVAITDVIRHEILVGAPTEEEFARLERMLNAIENYSLSDQEKHAFNHFGFELRQKGLLGKYTDLSIAFLAKERKIPIYSFDRYFTKLASAKVVRLFTL